MDVSPEVLVVEHLTKRFGDRLAVDDLSFSVTAGEVFGFLGPNGAGKTTTVRMLATLIAPSAGSATVAGIPLTPENGLEIRQRIAVMPESPGLYLRLTVAENLEFFAGLYGITKPQERIRQALDSVNLGGRANDLCASLSKGLRQRVGLARTLLSDPAIVFLDEPTSGLDPVASREVHQLIDNLRAERVTVFLTTHRLDEAERLCDRVAILNSTLRTIGPPEELRDRLFTKALLVRTAAPLPEPERVFAVAGVESWHADDAGRYSLSVSDAGLAAPNVTRALVAAGADVLSLAEARTLTRRRLPSTRRRGRRGPPMSTVSVQRVRTVVRKEVREFRRNRFVIVTMAVLPLIFLITPMLTIFKIPASASGPQVKAAVGVISLLMFIVPIVLPPVIAAYSVVGERDQGTLEPVLTAPVRASELLLGKAAAAFIPSVGIAYAIYLVVLISVRLGAAHVVSIVVWHPPQVLAQLLFTPLLALWAIWVGIGISTRTSDVRVAQQLATLASLPLLGFTSLVSFQVIKPSVPLAVGLALALLTIDIAAWRIVSQLFDRERLITGSHGRHAPTPRSGLP